MASINFPASPTVGDTFTANGLYFKWDGVKWNTQSTVFVNWVKKTNNYTAQNADRILADTTTIPFTITLPASPTAGDTILIADGGNWALNNLTVARNGSTIEGVAENLTLDIRGIRVDLVYSGTTWEVYAFTGPAELPDQTGNTGKVLSTNGSIVSWTEGLPSQTGNTGKYLSTDGTNASWAEGLPSQTGNTGKYLSTNGTSASWQTIVQTSITGTANQIIASNPTGSVTLSLPQSIATTSGVRFGSIGVGTAPSATTGEIRAIDNITAYYSDERLKENITPIKDAINKVVALKGVTYNSNDVAASFGYTNKAEQVGVIAQDVKQVLPQAVKAAPFDIGIREDGTEFSISGENYMTVQYEKLVPLLIEAIKDQQRMIEELQRKIECQR